MQNSANVNFKNINLTQQVAGQSTGIVYVMGQAKKGPFNKPEDVITSWSQFVSLYGGLDMNLEAPHLAKTLLDKGGSIRFCRVGNYTDITDPATLTATEAILPTWSLISLSGDLSTGEELVATVNGDALTGVTFDTDTATTLSQLVGVISNHPDVYSALYKDNTISVTPAVGITTLTVTLAITGGTTPPTATTSTVMDFVNTTGDPLFLIRSKYEGAGYNGLEVKVIEASNQRPGFFDLIIESPDSPELNESYQNIIIDSVSDSTYLNDVVMNSELVDVEYRDLSLLTDLTPLYTEVKLRGGEDGTAPTDNDYIGDSSSLLGLNAFDNYDDSLYLAIFDNNEDSVNVAAANYASSRHIYFFLHLSTDLKTTTALINKRRSLNIDTKFVYFVSGGQLKLNPLNNQVEEFSELPDVLALAVNSDENYGPWYSFAGKNRGVIGNSLGVINNFGSPARYKDLNLLANNQINMVVNRDNNIVLWGNFSGQFRYDQESQLSVAKLVTYLERSLKPTLETFLEEPNDIPTWRRIYYTVRPFLDGMVTKRALYEYEWQGDQDAGSLDDLNINKKADVQMGKYKVLFTIKAIPSIQEIKVYAVLTPAGVTFETEDLI